MVAQWYDLRLETRELSRDTVPDRCRPCIAQATTKLSTGTNGQKEGATSFFCPRRFDRAVMGRLRLALPMSRRRSVILTPGPGGPPPGRDSSSRIGEAQQPAVPA